MLLSAVDVGLPMSVHRGGSPSKDQNKKIAVIFTEPLPAARPGPGQTNKIERRKEKPSRRRPAIAYSPTAHPTAATRRSDVSPSKCSRTCRARRRSTQRRAETRQRPCGPKTACVICDAEGDGRICWSHKAATQLCPHESLANADPSNNHARTHRILR